MNSKKIFAILIIAAFIASAIAVMSPTQVEAQTTPTLKTYPIIDAIPNPIGVGQVTLIKIGILQQLGSVNYGWTGITVTVTKPDGTKETLGPFTTDSTGSTFTQFTPAEVGTYILTTNFPEQTSPINFLSTMKAATQS